MKDLHEEIYELTATINLVIATIETVKEKQMYYLWEENMYLADHFASEVVRLNKVLDKMYNKQEKLYKDLLIEFL